MLRGLNISLDILVLATSSRGGCSGGSGGSSDNSDHLARRLVEDLASAFIQGQVLTSVGVWYRAIILYLDDIMVCVVTAGVCRIWLVHRSRALVVSATVFATTQQATQPVLLRACGWCIHLAV